MKEQRLTTIVGEQLVESARQRLIDEESLMAQKLVAETHQREQYQAKIRKSFNPNDAAFQRSVVKRVATVLASENVVPMIDVQPGKRLEAWTNFVQIYIRYNRVEDIRLQSATIRGLMYHEGGHIRWSVPFQQLRNRAGRMGDNLTGLDLRRIQNAWNALEDQRMETAVVSDSPRKAAYFTPLVMTELVNRPDRALANWPLLIWRRYLPRDIRSGARAMFVDVYGESLAQDFERVTDSYVHAIDADVMWAAIVEYAGLMEQVRDMTLPQVADAHQAAQGANNNDAPMEIPIDPEMEAEGGAGDEDGENAGKGEAGKGEAGEDDSEPGEGQGAAGEDGEPGEAAQAEEVEEGGGKGASSKGHKDKLTQADLDKAIKEAEEERNNDSTLQNDVDSFHDTLNSQASLIPPYIAGRSNSASDTFQAEELAADIQRAFTLATAERMPGWVQNQKIGVLDVNRFMTAQPGDMEVFRRYTDDDQPGYNLAVSIMLDYSGSMDKSLVPLAQTGYACKLACQNLDIPCTVTLWDDSAAVLWDANEQATFLPLIEDNGGTDPTTALSDLDNQRFGKDRHLVIIMTDGRWDNGWHSRTLLPYMTPGRHILGVGFTRGSYGGGVAAAMEQYGCNDVIETNDLFDIPRALEHLIIDLS